jgi:1,4-alpha-glucan branching enzyme
MIRPTVMLIAEDHTGWPAVTRPPAAGGLGFDATWWVDFYHHLMGDSDMAGGKARLIRQAGFGGDEPLAFDTFAGALYDTRYNRIVFHKSHDEAGNAGSTARTLRTAVNHARLEGETRVVAEARSRVAFGLSVLSAGTPMFFMVDILWQSSADRVLAFKRWSGDEEVIIFASLNNRPFDQGYTISKDLLGIPNAGWKEIFNSDAAIYGGHNVGNAGATIASSDARLNVKIPANGFVLFVKQ